MQVAHKHVINQHKEAFCLMKYASQDGNIVEWIWNSRDGVTPFCISNPAGDVLLQHVNWELDRYLPSYQPHPGERIFVTLTEKRAIERANIQAQKIWDREDEDAQTIRQEAGTIENLALLLVKTYQIGTAPDLIYARDL